MVHCFVVVSLGKKLYTVMIHLTQMKMSTWLDSDGNVYDKLDPSKWLQDCMLSPWS